MSKASRARPRPRSAPEIQPAIALHRQGRLSEAERIYAAILAVDPGRSDALHLLGLANYQRGRLPEALRMMAAALKADPRSPDIYSNYGLALDRKSVV
jgi:tetratricopeptide (TPR) repeat protein